MPSNHIITIKGRYSNGKVVEYYICCRRGVAFPALGEQDCSARPAQKVGSVVFSMSPQRGFFLSRVL